jgi:FeS assembly SUF system protein
MSDEPNQPGGGGGERPASVSLPVLVSSNKVEQLRREFQADPPTRNVPEAPAPAPTAAAATTPPALDPARHIQRKLLEGKVIEALRQVYDPELPVNIYDLGLIYEIAVADDNSVKVKMTLTAPACPVAGTLPAEVERRVENVPEVKSAEVELVWDPPWSRDRMSEAAQLELGLF